MAHGKWIWLVSLRRQVQSLASVSGLRIWHCRELWCRSQMLLGSRVAEDVGEAGNWSSDSTPSLGTSICPKKTQKKKKFILLWRESLVEEMEIHEKICYKATPEVQVKNDDCLDSDINSKNGEMWAHKLFRYLLIDPISSLVDSMPNEGAEMRGIVDNNSY